MRKLAVYLVGLFILSTGVVLSIRSQLGVSPISALPYILSLILDIYVGRVVAAVFGILVLLQIAILRRKFKPISLFQLLFSAVFGLFVDLIMHLTDGIYFQTYFGRLALLLSGAFLLSLGIAVMIESKIAPLPPESLVVAACEVIPGGRFHVLKMVLDSSFALSALVLALVFFGDLQGVREGTIITALLVGRLVPFSRRVVLHTIERVGL